MEQNRKNVQRNAARLFHSLEEAEYEGWMCVQENKDDTRIKEWSFIAAKSPEELFRLVFHLVEIIYMIEDE